MTSLGRRRFLQVSGLLGAAAIGACDTAPAGGSGGSNVLHWWDHFNPLRPLHKKMFAKFEKSGGMPVEYTYHQTAKMGQALQLAKQSDQLPDVHTRVGLKLPIPALIKEGWWQPMDIGDEALGRLPEGALVDGLHIFDGKTYTFPIFSFRQYWAANWFNTELLEKAGVDPASPPATYDDFRAAARAVQKAGGDGVYGLISNFAQPRRVEEQVTALAQAAGFGGNIEGLDYRTGEHAFHSDYHVAVIEFLLSLQKDGLLFPGSVNFTDKVARARWAAGAAGFFFDGPWCPGVVKKDLSQFLDKLGVGPMLVPEAGMPVTAYRGAQNGDFWLTEQAKHPDEANTLLARFTSNEYHAGLATRMDQPPIDLSAVEKAADVHPAYRKVVRLFSEGVFLAPVPVARNIEITKVQAESSDVQPGLGEIVQGVISGDVTDVRRALKELSDKTAAERERAMREAKDKQGAKVSLDDWAFPDWRPRTDYTPDKYA